LILVVTQPSAAADRSQPLPAGAYGTEPRAEPRLAHRRPRPAQWDAALDAPGEAPLIAVRSDLQEIAAVAPRRRRTLDELSARGADPVVAAERWARSELPCGCSALRFGSQNASGTASGPGTL
jgi:hypothetical protein